MVGVTCSPRTVIDKLFNSRHNKDEKINVVEKLQGKYNIDELVLEFMCSGRFLPLQRQ